MNSICTVCKKWNELINLVLIEEIELRLKSKQKKIIIKIINFSYEDNYDHVVEFYLGTISIYEEKISEKVVEVKYNIKFKYKDCKCISIKEDTQNATIIEIEKYMIPLKKMCVVLDLLDK